MALRERLSSLIRRSLSASFSWVRHPALRLESAPFAGSLLVALSTVIAARVWPATPPRPVVAAWRDAFVIGQLLAAAVIAHLALVAWSRFAPKRRGLGFLALALAALVLTGPALRADLSVLAGKIGLPRGLAHALLVVSVSLAIPLAALLGRLLARPYLHLLGVAFAIALAIANHLTLPTDYAGGHLVAVIAAAALASAALASREPRPASRIGRVARIALALIGAAAVLRAPRYSVALALSRVPGSVISPWLAALRERDDADDVSDVLDPARAEWWRPRTGRPATPPSMPSLLPRDAIVVLVVIDCMRADLLTTAAHARKLPALSALRAKSVDFKLARVTAPATASSVSAMFSGLYYSQQYWSNWPGASAEWVYPHRDVQPRLTDLLKSAGIATVTFSGMPGITNAYGVVHGIAEENQIKGVGRLYPLAGPIMAPAIERISAQPSGAPMFLYMHFTDGHAPYDTTGRGSPMDRYLRGIAGVDAEVHKLLAAIDADPALKARTALIVTADHGEAFGEHGTHHHATTLYEELIRVPLLIRLPGVAPRAVDRPVSLLDLAPTVLDLFGQPTPGNFMGESLTPFFRGADPPLTRPIAADSSRLQRAMVFPDGLKIIHDRRRGTVELYDIGKDPKEKRDLFEDHPEGQKRLRLLKAFFKTHTHTRPEGYVVPYGR